MLRTVEKSEVVEAVEEINYKFIKERALSNHPDDWYLRVVMGYSETKQEYAVWIYNAHFKGLYEGYYTRDKEAVIEKYANK